MAGRPESPLDPAAGPAARLAYDLRLLRAGAGTPTYREMAARTGCGASTLSQAAAGERLPTLATLRAFVTACGGSLPEWEERWHRVAAGEPAVPRADADSAAPPYRGLERFQPEDRALFFGRDDLIAQLVDRVRHYRLVAVVGASGSGKSSLLRAGLIPALREAPDSGPSGPGPHGPGPQRPGPHGPGSGGGSYGAGASGGGFAGAGPNEAGSGAGSAGPGSGRGSYGAGLSGGGGYGAGASGGGFAGAGPNEAGSGAGSHGASPYGSGSEPVLRPAAIRILTPGRRPATARGHLLAPSQGAGGGNTVVVVDQFEELFTLGADGTERAAFLDLVLAAVRPERRLRVVIGVRADFFGRLAEHPGLADALRDATLLVAPMDPAAVRQAVVRPAAAAGLIVERSLTERIIREAGEEPGGLPLMSHALLETWRRRRGRALTERMYEAAGGIHGAISATAEDVYTRLSPEQAAAARRILLRLITPGEGAQDTRRPAGRAELGAVSPDAPDVLERLVGARLLTSDGDTVDLAHEALISAWPRYRSWVDEDRERLRLHRRLTEAARTWDELDRDPGALYRGSRLADAAEAFGPGARDELNALERDFLDAGTGARDAEARTAVRAARRLRSLSAALALLLVLAVTAGGVAWRQSRSGDRARAKAVAARQTALSRQLAAESDALAGTDTEMSMLLAVQAYRTAPTAEAAGSLYRAAAVPLRHVLPEGQGPVVGLAFSHDGRTVAWGEDDGRVLRADVATGRTRTVLGSGAVAGTRGTALALAFSAGDRAVVGAFSDAGVRTVDLATGRVRVAVPGHPHLEEGDGPRLSADGGAAAGNAVQGVGDGAATPVLAWDTATGRSHRVVPAGRAAAAVSPDGRYVAARDSRGLTVWDTVGRLRGTLPCSCRTAVFSPDGRTLAADDADGSVAVWPWAEGQGAKHITVSSDLGNTVRSLAFGPDPDLLATGMADGSVGLWNTATGHRTAALGGLGEPVGAIALSGDGRTLAVGTDDGTLRLFDTAGALVPAVLTAAGPHASDTSGIAFVRGGRDLATGRDDGGVLLWPTGASTGGPTAPPPLGLDPPAPSAADPSAPVQRLLSTADGRTVGLVPGGRTVPVRLWDTATGRSRSVGDPTGAAALSADGRTLATVVQGVTVRLWDATGGRSGPVTLPYRSPSSIGALAFSPDGRVLAVRNDSDRPGDVVLLDAAGGRPLRTLDSGGPPDGAAPGPGGAPLVFSPDGRTLAVGTADGATRLWDTATGRLRATLTSGSSPVTSAGFGPDGRTLAIGVSDGTTRLWDVSTRQVRETLTASSAPVTSVAFSPDGRVLATAGLSGIARLWRPSLPAPAAALAAVCAAVGREPTPQERSRYLPSQPLPPPCGTLPPDAAR